MKTKLSQVYRALTTMTLFLALTTVSAQTIVLNAPQPAVNPNLGGTDPWWAICAGGNGGFNEYFARITWAGSVNSSNEFILELSDASGSFADPVELARTADHNGNTNFLLSFAIPTTTRGQGYKMRARSTNPAKTSPESAAYNMYYMDVTSNLNISQSGNGVPPGSICSINPIVLQVDNIPNPETYQYIWYRNATEIVGQKGHTLNVTSSGMYNAYIDYGAECTGNGNTDSNMVDVTIGSSGQGIFITPPANTGLCTGDTETLTINTTAPGWSYRWYKDGTLIPGATNPSYAVNAALPGFEGEYQVEISAIGICTERSAAIAITNADGFTITETHEPQLVLLPAQTKTLGVTTSASAPVYQWYRNNVQIGGATSSTYSATQEGTYYVAITQGGGTCPGTIKNSGATTIVTPASFEIIADHASAYTACASTSAVLEVKTINAILADNSKLDVTADVVSDFGYQWKKDGVNVAGANAQSISLTDTEENGTYSLEGTLGAYATTSNTVPVQLLTNETLTISSTGTVFCSASDALTLTASTNLTGESFVWQRDGAVHNTTDIALAVTAPGTYRLVLDKGGCSLISNEIIISPINPDLITLSPTGIITFAEGTSRTVTASGGTSYRWYNANNVEVGNGASMDFAQEGTYTLIAQVDNCEVVKQLTVEYLDTFRVPNVITPNGDGVNDQWILPNSYSNKADVNVIIYNSNGEEILNVFDYKNNWPQSSTEFVKQNMVFFYKIRKDNAVLKQGTITVIR